MNKGIIAALSFVAGALAGGVGVYYYTKKQYDEKMNNETKELKEYYDRKYQLALDNFQGRVALYGQAEALIKEHEDKKKAKAKEAASKTSEKATEPTNRDKEAYENVVKTDYNAVSTPPKKATTTKKKKKTETSKEPYIITFEEYEADRKHDKRIITYLDREDMIVDEEYEPAEDGLEWVGRDNLENLELSNDEDVVYVRNDAMGTDFQVVINVTSTYEDFLRDSL